MRLERSFEIGVVLGLIMFCVILVGVLATGSTFGQRCSELHEKNSAEWHKCVKELSEEKQCKN